MHKLEQLIQEFCPNGVKFFHIGECVVETEKMKWKNEKDRYQYIDLTSVDRNTHQILETITIDVSNAPSRAQQIV